MGEKFRLSPKIDAQLSQRTEGKIRDRNKKLENQTEKTKDKKAQSTDKDRAERLEDKTTKPSRLRPYVDVPPKRVMLTEPVNQSPSKEEVTYKNRAPVEIGLDIEKIVDSVMDMEITIPLKGLAGISGAIQKEIKKQMTKARIPVDEMTQEKKIAIIAKPKVYLHDIPVESKVIKEDISEEILKGHVVGGDPALQYLEESGTAELTHLVVGKMTEPLRAIYTRINGVGQEECLMDGGSSIVSMSKQVAVQLGLVWDPGIRIDMESASKHVERTLGVARNTLFEVGGLKLHLQVHILESPPYRVLLGRPFLTLAEAVTQTSGDGSEEIVIKDPNTKRVAVVPTYKRGETPEDLQKTKYKDF